jgi:hypothetical protein
VTHVPILGPPSGRHRSRGGAAPPRPAGTTPTASERLDTRAAHRIVALMVGLATFLNNWPAATEVQVAASAAGGDTGFVVFAMAAESAAVAILMVVLLRHSVAGRWTRTAATWTAAAGLLVPAVAPSRITLLIGLMAVAWMTQSVTTLRGVVSDAPGDEAAGGQQRVQTWVYRVVLAAQITYVAFAWITNRWWTANVFFAGVLFTSGLMLLINPTMRRADPKVLHLPGTDQPLLAYRKYRPAVWAVLSLALSWVIYGIFFAAAQPELTRFGWKAGAASWIVVGIAATRVLTLRLRRGAGRDGGSSRRNQQHGRVLASSAFIMCASSAVLLLTILPVGRWPATTGLVTGGVVFQVSMNRSNPIVREYLAARSVDVSNLLNVGGMVGVLIGGGLPTILHWPGLVGVWGACAVGMVAIARATLAHRYDQLLAVVPEVDVYEFTAARTEEELIRCTVRPRRSGPDLGGYEPVAPFEAGPGTNVMISAPLNPGMRFQYWPFHPLFTVLWNAEPLHDWLRDARPRPRTRGATQQPSPAPHLSLIGWPDAIVADPGTGQRYVDMAAAVAHEAVIARGSGSAPYLTDDRLVNAVITYEDLHSWEVVERLVLPNDRRFIPLRGEATRQAPDGPRRGRWIVTAEALGLPTELVTRARGRFLAGSLVTRPLHWLCPRNTRNALHTEVTHEGRRRSSVARNLEASRTVDRAGLPLRDSPDHTRRDQVSRRLDVGSPSMRA